MVTGILKVFSIRAYDLLDQGTTLSFVTPLVAKCFEILPDFLHEPFIVSTLVGELDVAKNFYKKLHEPLVLLDIFYFDVIFGMDCLHAFFASINCRTRVVKLYIPNDPCFLMEWGKLYS